jgi:hypothetical protein
VFVTLQDEFSLTIVVGTPKNLQYLMEKGKVNFYGPGLPWIIVQKLTKGIIQEAIEAYMDGTAIKNLANSDFHLFPGTGKT